VFGRAHICWIWLLAIESFFKKVRRYNSGTSDRSMFPLTSSSVRFLNFWISPKLFTPLFTNLNEINEGGFLTSERLLMAVVFELKLLLLLERWPKFVLIVLGSFCNF